ncbi:hypothetical protein, partial [Simiduia litorea]
NTRIFYRIYSPKIRLNLVPFDTDPMVAFEVTTNSKASILKHQDRAEVNIVITYDAFSIEDLKLSNGNL